MSSPPLPVKAFLLLRDDIRNTNTLVAEKKLPTKSVQTLPLKKEKKLYSKGVLYNQNQKGKESMTVFFMHGCAINKQNLMDNIKTFFTTQCKRRDQPFVFAFSGHGRISDGALALNEENSDNYLKIDDFLEIWNLSQKNTILSLLRQLPFGVLG